MLFSLPLLPLLPLPPLLLGLLKAGCSMMALKSWVPRSAFVSGRWPLGASRLYLNSFGHFLRDEGAFGAAIDGGWGERGGGMNRPGTAPKV